MEKLDFREPLWFGLDTCCDIVKCSAESLGTWLDWCATKSISKE